MKCRSCGSLVSDIFVDLGMSPLSNSFLTPAEGEAPQIFYPLCPKVCRSCFLVQLPAFELPEHIFRHYHYLSSCSETWLKHAKSFSDFAIKEFNLTKSSLVIEIASNDGYLLQYFKESAVPVLGIEPATNVAQIAQAKGIEVISEFFGSGLAKRLQEENRRADLLVANNVVAHVPDINDFLSGFEVILSPSGVASVEFPHLLNLMELVQFDTIYHEHFSYLSFFTFEKILDAQGLKVFDVQKLTTHGGSLRVFFERQSGNRPENPRVSCLRKEEKEAGLTQIDGYQEFANKVKAAKRDLLTFIIEQRRLGKSVVGYGAPAKGNTLLNYCGVGPDLIDYTVDRNHLKQGMLCPGTLIPIHDPSMIFETKPDYLLILPWNIKDEVIEQMKGIRAWGGKFVVPIPSVMVFE